MTHQVQSWLAEQQDFLEKTLFDWASINSGSYHLDGVNRMVDQAEVFFEALQGQMTRVQLPTCERLNDQSELEPVQVGDLLPVTKRPEAPYQVLLCGHLDTVFPKDHPFQQVSKEKGIIHGPGVADMKGGVIVMRSALMAFEQFCPSPQIGWTVILNPDEEIGSLASRTILDDYAVQAD